MIAVAVVTSPEDEQNRLFSRELRQGVARRRIPGGGSGIVFRYRRRTPTVIGNQHVGPP